MKRAATSKALERFASLVCEVAGACEPWHPGCDKRYISRVWDRLHGERLHATLAEVGVRTGGDFKARLVEANREGLLTLARADLTSAFDAAELKRSEINYLTATFHLIRVPPRSERLAAPTPTEAAAIEALGARAAEPRPAPLGPEALRDISLRAAQLGDLVRLVSVADVPLLLRDLEQSDADKHAALCHVADALAELRAFEADPSYHDVPTHQRVRVEVARESLERMLRAGGRHGGR